MRLRSASALRDSFTGGFIVRTRSKGDRPAGYGFVLNDRGALFSLNPKSPNVIAPGKRPFHTLLPGFLMRGGQPVMAFGLMGGSQQAQGHAQVLIAMIDLGANPQAASDAARFSQAQATNTRGGSRRLNSCRPLPIRARPWDRLASNPSAASTVAPPITARMARPSAGSAAAQGPCLPDIYQMVDAAEVAWM